MAENRIAPAGFQINTRQAVVGALLMGAGGLLGVAGAALAGAAFATALRRRVQQLDVPPSVLARQNWARMKTATAAGVGAWRDSQNAPLAAQPS